MPDTTKRTVTEGDKYEIQVLWSDYQAFRQLAARSRESSPDGHWIAAAAERAMADIVLRLDQLFNETAP